MDLQGRRDEALWADCLQRRTPGVSVKWFMNNGHAFVRIQGRKAH